MFNAGGPSLADIAAVTGNRNNDGGWGDGNGWWVLIILFALFGWGGNGGWGNNGQNGVGAEVQRGFDTQAIIGKLDGINNGLCDGFYATNTSILQGNFGLQNAIQQNTVAGMQQANALQAQLTDCCCENRAAIAQVRYDMATDTCAITTAVNQGFAQLDRTISDQFCQLKMEQKDAKIAEQQNLINALNLAQSQANQNQYLVNQLRPCPTPAYITGNPWATNGTSYNGCCGQNYGGCC